MRKCPGKKMRLSDITGAARVAGPVSALQTNLPSGTASASAACRVWPTVRPAIVHWSPTELDAKMSAGCRVNRMMGSGMKGKLSQTRNPRTMIPTIPTQTLRRDRVRRRRAAPLAQPGTAAGARISAAVSLCSGGDGLSDSGGDVVMGVEGQTKIRQDACPHPAAVSTPCDARLDVTQFRVKAVTQPVAQQVHGEDGEHDGKRREKEEPPGGHYQSTPISDH